MNVSTAIKLAAALAALSLLVAPFRSSAGIRAALLVLAALVLLGAGWLARAQARSNANDGVRFFRIPTDMWLRTAVVAWVGWAVLAALLQGAFLSTLIAMRGDMLTPLLAAMVMYSVARPAHGSGHEFNVRLILLALFAGLLILAGMAWWDPARPGIGNHEPRYVSVGWLSSWVVMLAALLPLAFAHAKGRWRLACWVAVVALLVAAWNSQNRIVWLCFGAMFTIYDLRQSSSWGVRRVLIGLLVGVVAAVGMFMLASQMRAEQFPAAQVNAVSILKQDDRQEIWQAAINVIRQKPLTGHGYRAAAGEKALAAQFTEPGFGVVFRHAHNMVLNAAIQLGVPGALTLLLLFAAMAIAFARGAKGAAPESEARIAATCGLMLVTGFFLRNMTDDFFARHGVLLFGALVGLLLARVESQPTQAPTGGTA